MIDIMTNRITMWATLETINNGYFDIPTWHTHCEGDQGDSEHRKRIELSANHFPPGTKIEISEPECPICQTVPVYIKSEGKWRCCSYDWNSHNS